MEFLKFYGLFSYKKIIKGNKLIDKNNPLDNDFDFLSPIDN